MSSMVFSGLAKHLTGKSFESTTCQASRSRSDNVVIQPHPPPPPPQNRTTFRDIASGLNENDVTLVYPSGYPPLGMVNH
jgi:hypothetical protein